MKRREVEGQPHLFPSVPPSKSCIKTLLLFYYSYVSCSEIFGVLAKCKSSFKSCLSYNFQIIMEFPSTVVPKACAGPAA